MCRNEFSFQCVCPVGAGALSTDENEQEVELGQGVVEVEARTAGRNFESQYVLRKKWCRHRTADENEIGVIF